MFVVKRPFKNLGKVYVAGSVITEPANIKRFKGKLAEGKIIDVTEQTYDSIAKYFKSKHGVILPPLHESTEEVDNEEVDNEEVDNEEVDNEEKAKVAKATPVKAEKKVAKAVAK